LRFLREELKRVWGEGNKMATEYSDKVFELFDPGFRVKSSKAREETVKSIANMISQEGDIKESWGALSDEEKVSISTAFSEYNINLDTIMKGEPLAQPKTGWQQLGGLAKEFAKATTRAGVNVLDIPLLPQEIATEYGGRMGERISKGEKVGALLPFKELLGSAGKVLKDRVTGDEWFPKSVTLAGAMKRASGGRELTPVGQAIGTVIDIAPGLGLGYGGSLKLRKLLKMAPNEGIFGLRKRLLDEARKSKALRGLPETNVIDETMEKVPFNRSFIHPPMKVGGKLKAVDKYVVALPPEEGMPRGMIMVREARTEEALVGGLGKVYPMNVENFWRKYGKQIERLKGAR